MIEDIVKNLEKGRFLLENIEDDKYTDTTTAPYYSSIGGHVRHILDMFACVFKGYPSKYIDLTKRERNKNIEDFTVYGIAYFNSIIEELKKIEVHALETFVVVVDDSGSGVKEVKTTLGAILMQAQSHTIHHYATIGYLMHTLGICLPIDGFGMNPTTPCAVSVKK